MLYARQDTDAEKVAKLERALDLYEIPDALPLFTALFALPTPADYPIHNFTPQKQKERTLQALLQLLIVQAERQATVMVWEDVHWADPSSLEFLTLFIDQLPIAKLLLVLTFRPEFAPPWPPRSHLSHLVLNRLGQKQVEAMIEKAATGHELTAEVIEQIRVKTDGVPLFVEELTKSVIETVGTQPAAPRQLAIPATLQDALMARLDRLPEARPVAQLGATLGREFSFELLHAVSPVNEAELQTALSKLVEAEILYQRGMGEHARYFFKHVLIQDTAYQSLLKSTRQQYHTQIAQVLEERFPDTKENQPELLAYHYTEAGLTEQAIPYWQQAGQKAIERSANQEAISYVKKGLDLLQALPDAFEYAEQELSLQFALSLALSVAKGYGDPEIEKPALRARELCQQLKESPQIVPVLWRLVILYQNRGELQTARELSEQMLRLAQNVQDRYLLSVAHDALGRTLYSLGELPSARSHVEQALVLYDSQEHAHPVVGTSEPRPDCLSYASWILWRLGYPDQALDKSRDAIALASELSHPLGLTSVLGFAALFYLHRREEGLAREKAEMMMTLATEQGFPYWVAIGMLMRGWVLAEQGQEEEGIIQMRQSRMFLLIPYVLAEAYGKVGQVEDGLDVIAEALVFADKSGSRVAEAELYRLKGELTLAQENQKSKGKSQKSKIETDAQAEACFLKAIEIARKQQAKSWELRASTSLARLWRQRGKKAEAHQLLANVYNWFTEGFDTKDLQEAKALLEELVLLR